MISLFAIFVFYSHTQEEMGGWVIWGGGGQIMAKQSHATWPYSVSSLEMTFRVIAITAATGGFMCVSV